MQQLELGGRQMNWLEIIKKKIEKQKRLHQAQLAMAMR